MALTLEVRFLLGGFAASDGHDDTAPEWPPAPARIFSAVVAGCEAGHSAALEWLEAQPPPEILAGEATDAVSHRRYLVTNSRVTEKGGSALHPGREAVPRARRRRFLAHPRVVYHWPSAEPTPGVVSALDDAARRVGYLGRPTSPAILRLSQVPPAPEPELDLYTPTDGSDAWEGLIQLRVPYPGLLADLRAAYDADEHVVPPVYATYGRSRPGPPRLAPAWPIPWAELLTLRFEPPVWLPGEATLTVTSAFRDAVLARVGQRLPSGVKQIHGRISGHGVAEPHVAFLALPYVDSPHADGHLLGLALAVPHADRSDVIDQMRQAFERSPDGLLRIELTNVPGQGRLRLVHSPHRPAEGPWGVVPLRWTRPSHRWRTVIPAVLDRAPSRRLSEEDAVIETIRAAGLPTPLAAQTSTAPFVSGDVHLRPRQTVRRPTDRIRPFRHLLVTFPEEVAGPVIIGALRHFGLGLCAPVIDETPR